MLASQMSILQTPPPLQSDSQEAEIQAWLVYLKQKYPTPTYNLYEGAPVMYKDGNSRKNWRARQQHEHPLDGALFSDWVRMKMLGATIRLGLFLTPQGTWIGERSTQELNPIVWAAGLRPSIEYTTGRDLIIWDTNWEEKYAGLIENKKVLCASTGLTGGQKELYKYLKDPQKGKVGIQSIWKGGRQARDDKSMQSTVEWLGNILENGGLEQDLTEMGFSKLQ